MLSIETERNFERFRRELLVSCDTSTPTWSPPNENYILEISEETSGTDEAETEKLSTGTRKKEVEEMLQELESISELALSLHFPLHVSEFEKDDDTNFHIDWITATTNLRARNYQIPEENRHKCKIISGRIIPAMVTTTAAITGIVCVEAYKLILGLDVSLHCCSSLHLGCASFSLQKCSRPKKMAPYMSDEVLDMVEPIPDGFTCWDKIVIDQGNITIQQLLHQFPTLHHACTFESLFFQHGQKHNQDDHLTDQAIWLKHPPSELHELENQVNLHGTISEVYERCYGKLPEGRNYVVAYGSLTQGSHFVVVPTIQIFFR
eukprot:TRINITY_DN6755_c0_g1_i14.p1 TRINITY_DN6755_c0_g1~~TRINITY_DN6755_c0_g1_i14.p1  ORF type:complete len:320 (-),score=77.16 TRINITY_DN6755_c0_g1_i14:386-1345(-)